MFDQLAGVGVGALGARVRVLCFEIALGMIGYDPKLIDDAAEIPGISHLKKWISKDDEIHNNIFEIQSLVQQPPESS